jgi:hypothetical protein
MVCCLLFNFAVSFDFGCCSLAQEMRFVDCNLTYFRQRLVTNLLSVLLAFQPLFAESLHGDQLLIYPLLRCASSFPPTLLCASFHFVIYAGVFLQVGVSVCPGDDTGLSQGWLGEYHVMLGAHLFGLPNVSQAGLKLASGSVGSPPVFSV